MAQRKRRTYTAEQKADAVRLVRQTGSVSKVAKDLDLTETSLRNCADAEAEGLRLGVYREGFTIASGE